MPPFIEEPDLIARGLSEQDFKNGETLTPEHIDKLSDLIELHQLDKSKLITVRKEPNRHGITLVQS